MDVTKPYEFIWFGAMDVTKPYEFIGFGAMFQRLKPKLADFWGRHGLLPPGKPSGKVGGFAANLL
jgi:hypothetical protein